MTNQQSTTSKSIVCKKGVVMYSGGQYRQYSWGQSSAAAESVAVCAIPSPAYLQVAPWHDIQTNDEHLANSWSTILIAKTNHKLNIATGEKHMSRSLLLRLMIPSLGIIRKVWKDWKWKFVKIAKKLKKVGTLFRISWHVTIITRMGHIKQVSKPPGKKKGKKHRFQE